MGTPKKTRVRLDLSYDGSYFMGWQRQTEHSETIQGILEQSLKQILKEKVSVVGSGRTDRGTHALHQTCHFDLSFDPSHIQLQKALNSTLPRSIAVKACFITPQEFHALRSAQGKIYSYLIHNHSVPNPLEWKKSLWVPRAPLNINYLSEISQLLVGTQDFKSFQNQGTEVKTTVRTIWEAKWTQSPPHWIHFQIYGNGFLKQMVRNIVGTLLAMERQSLPKETLLKIISGKNRSLAFKTAPSDGLYLTQIIYPKELDNRCRKF